MKKLNSVLGIDEVPRHRFESCVNYEDCLDLACKGKMASFSCMDCERYEDGGPIEISVEKESDLTFPEPPKDLKVLARTLEASMKKQGYKNPKRTNAGFF